MANYNAIKYDGFSKGSTTLIKTLTASSSGTLDFVDGTSDVVLDSTYKEYLFIFNNIHAATDETTFTFQGNAAGGSGYNETITSTSFRAMHNEDGGSGGIAYQTGLDLAQSTSIQSLNVNQNIDNDGGTAGYLYLFNPSCTTFIKHVIAETASMHNSSDPRFAMNTYTAGYFNTTSAIDEIQFKMSSGNIDAGTIQLIGIT